MVGFKVIRKYRKWSVFISIQIFGAIQTDDNLQFLRVISAVFVWCNRSMAAALVAVNRRLLLQAVLHDHASGKHASQDLKKVQIVHTMPTDEKIILKRGILSRQTMTSSAGVIYTKRVVVVTAECIYFGKCDTREAVEVLDYIPLLEIKQQSLVEDKKPEKTAASSTPLSDVQQPSVLWTNEEDAEALTITIKTSHDGHNSGRSTILMAFVLEPI